MGHYLLGNLHTFSLANDMLGVVYTTWWQHCHSHYKSTSTRIVYESINCLGWTSHEGPAILHHVEEHL